MAANIIAVDHTTHKAWYNPSSTSWRVDDTTSQVAVFAHALTYEGTDHISLRYTNMQRNYFQFFIHEDICTDTEIEHCDEDVGYLAINRGIHEDMNDAPVSGVCACNSFGLEGAAAGYA